MLKKLLSLTLCCCFLAGCSLFGGSKETPKPEAPKPATTQTAPANKEETPKAPAKPEAKPEAKTEASKPQAEKKQEAPAPVKPSVKQEKPQSIRILIKKSQFMLYVFENDKQIAAYPCALGKNPGQKQKSGDMKTPNGTFRVDEICNASWWTHDFKDGKGEIKGAYGPWFISLDTSALSKGAWDGIGIHGTHDNSSLGTRASEGCIRLKNENVEALKKIVTVGTMVTIEE